MTLTIASPTRINESIPVSYNSGFIFIGPLRNQNHFCFQCFKDRLKEMGLEKYYLSAATSSLTKSDNQLIQDLQNRLLENKDVPLLYVINRETYEIERRSTFKRGDCSVCGNDLADDAHKQTIGMFTKGNLRLETFSEVKDRLDTFKDLIYQSETSIINHVTRTGDSYGTPMVQSEVLFKDISMLSYGRTDTFGKSKYISLLESLERYATAFPYQTKNKVPLTPENNQVDLTLLEVMQLNHYENIHGLQEDTPIHYSEAEALHTEKEVLIPEQLIYYNSHVVSGEQRYIYESSNGSALGSNLDEASLHAMLELIERDAFLATWYGRIPPTKINIDEYRSSKINYYISALKKRGILVHLFEISMEVKIPTIWVLLEKENPENDDMAFYTAAASSLDLEDAIEKALIEATTAISVFENMFKKPDYLERKRLLLRNPDQVTNLEDHLLLYSNLEKKEVFSFALDSPYKMSKKELTEYYDNYTGLSVDVIEKFHNKILKISDKAYRVPIKNPNLTVCGLVNVKYIVPGMLTMTFGHQHKRVVYSRVEKAINFKQRGHLSKEWIRENPHPFP